MHYAYKVDRDFLIATRTIQICKTRPSYVCFIRVSHDCWSNVSEKLLQFSTTIIRRAFFQADIKFKLFGQAISTQQSPSWCENCAPLRKGKAKVKVHPITGLEVLEV